MAAEGSTEAVVMAVVATGNPVELPRTQLMIMEKMNHAHEQYEA